MEVFPGGGGTAHRILFSTRDSEVEWLLVVYCYGGWACSASVLCLSSRSCSCSWPQLCEYLLQTTQFFAALQAINLIPWTCSRLIAR